ncbi:hypothetical protein MKX03_027101, partial [Papaver bracteatum]
ETKLRELKYYKKEMVNIEREGTKLKKTAEKASIPSKTSIYSFLIGGFINLQTMRMNAEYYWLSIALRVTMLLGTTFIIVMSAMKLRKAEKDLLQLQARQEPVYSEVDKLKEDIQNENPDQSTLLHWRFKKFKKLAAKRETYGKRTWSHWFCWSIFSLFCFIIPILLLLDTVINGKIATSALLFGI